MVWGWDSQVSYYPDFEMEATKVFANDVLVFGIAGSLRLQNILRYMDLPTPPTRVSEVDKYMLKTLSNALREEFRDVEFAENRDGSSTFSGVVLVSLLGKVYEFSPNFTAHRSKTKTYGIGSGSAFALGALAAGADPLTALKIAAKMDTGTGGRLYVKTESEVLG